MQPACDNALTIVSRMRPHPIFLLILAAAQLCAAAFGSQAQTAPSSLVLTGGTVIDVNDWGRSANDLPNAVVIIRETGSRMWAPRPRCRFPRARA